MEKTSWRKTGVAPEGYQIVPADGRWAWVVLLGCILCASACITCNMTFGLALNDMIYAMKTNTATISWALAIASGLGNLIGPLATIVTNKYSCRTSAVLGGLICSVGMVASSYVSRVEVLCVTFGVLTGVGKKLVVVPVSVVVCQYFKKYLAICMGIVSATYAGARLITAPLIQLVLEDYGFRGAFLIVGGLTLHMCLGGLLFQPSNWHTRLVPLVPDDYNEDASDDNTTEQPVNRVEEKNGKYANGILQCAYSKIPQEKGAELPKDDKFIVEVNQNNCKCLIKKRCYSEMSVNLASSWDIFSELRLEPCKDCDKKLDDGDKAKKRWFANSLLKSIDLTLLKEGIFYVMCFDSSLVSSTAIYMSVYLFHAGVEQGLYPMQSAGLSSFRSFGEMSGRVAGPVIITLLKLKIMPTYIISLLLHGVSLIVLTLLTSVVSIYSVGVVSGLLFGAAVGLQGVLFVEIVGIKRFSSVLGLSSFFQGIFLFIMGPFIGWLRDTTGSYISCVLFLGSLQFVNAGLWTVTHLLKRHLTATSDNGVST